MVTEGKKKPFRVHYVRNSGRYKGEKGSYGLHSWSAETAAIDFLNMHAERADVVKVEEMK